MTKRLIAVFALFVLAAPAAAEPVRHGDLLIEGPWARASVVANGAAYVTIRNEGEAPERLLGASSDVAERVEIHESRVEDGIMRMERMDAIEIAPGETLVLEPGGFHVMLMGLEDGLAEGTSFEMTLRFERAGAITVTVPVRSMGAGGGQHRHHE